MAGQQVVPVEDWLSKLKAAVATRNHLHIPARTDARAAVSLDEAIDREPDGRHVGQRSGIGSDHDLGVPLRPGGHGSPETGDDENE